MTEDTVLERLCNLPVDFGQMNLSPIALIERSGYLNFPDALSRKRVEQFLRDNPALVGEWEGWSDDQRTSPAWIFRQRDNEQLVYLYPDGESLRFTDRFEACSEFVVQQILSIARFAKKSPI